MGTFALLCTTLFSCTADEYETDGKKTEIKKDVIPTDGTQAYVKKGPGDQPIIITPPK